MRAMAEKFEGIATTSNPTIAQAYLVPAGRSAGIMLERELISVGSTSETGSNIVIDDSSVSRRHAMFRKIENLWLVQDLGSTNGTRINGKLIERPTRLNPGDRIAFGRARFVFRNLAVLDRIFSLSPYEFENLIGKLFEKLEFDTTVTQQSADGGVDIEANKSGVATAELVYRGKYLIQCKRYNPKNRVARPDVQQFKGAIVEGARGIFVTTSSFSRHAKEYAERNGINLIDDKELERLISRYKLL